MDETEKLQSEIDRLKANHQHVWNLTTAVAEIDRLKQQLSAIRRHWMEGVSEETIRDPARPWYDKMDELLGGTVEDE